MLAVHQASAQVRQASQIPRYNLVAADYEAVTYIPPAFDVGSKLRSSATFEIQFSSNFPENARAAFRYAADIWGFYLDSDQTIVVRADWEQLPERTLGSAGPLLVGNFSGAAYESVWYAVALANAISGTDVLPAHPDIQARFNSEFPGWYFGLDGRVPSDRHDFVTVVLHELGHGLGFSGSFEVDDGDPENGDECPGVPAGWGCWGITAGGGSTPFPIIFDLFVEDNHKVSLMAESVYPNPSQELAGVLQSDAIFFDGDFSRPINDDVPISLYAPASFDAGSSFSHLDENAFATPPGGPANPDALMTPFLARGEAIHDPGVVTCAMFEDFGWPMGDGCLARFAASVGVENDLPEVSGYSLSGFYPNPIGDIARATLQVQAPQDVQVEIFDVAGRRVASLPRRHLGSNDTHPIHIDAAGWAAGVYFIRIQGETFSSVRTIVRIER